MSDTQMLRRATLYEALKDSGERRADDEHVYRDGQEDHKKSHRCIHIMRCGEIALLPSQMTRLHLVQCDASPTPLVPSLAYTEARTNNAATVAASAGTVNEYDESSLSPAPSEAAWAPRQ